MKWDPAVEEGEWDEELLPDESPPDLDEHTSSLHSNVFLLLHGERNVLCGFFESWKIVLSDEEGIFLRNECV